MKRFLTILILVLSCLISLGQTRDTCIISTIRYEVNSNTPLYDDGYDIFINQHLPFLQENQKHLKSVYITGSASPEGDRKNNHILAIKRAVSISSMLDIPRELIDIQIIDEDYDELYNLIKNSNESYKQKILNILDTSNDVKYDLKKSGAWVDLHKKYFYKLRRSTIEMYFEFPDTVKSIQNDTIYIETPIYLHDTVFIHPNINIIPLIAIKSNILSDLLITPNIQAELYTYLWNTSVEFDYTFPWWNIDSNHLYYQLLNSTIGIRKYFGNYEGWFAGIYYNNGYYDFSFGDKGWQGEERGCGLSGGYTWRKNRWKVEALLRIGWINSNYDVYYPGNPYEGKYYYDWNKKISDFVPRRFNMDYFGPTGIGIIISYDFVRLKRYEEHEIFK